MIPRTGASVGFAAGAVLALYPGQLVRSTFVECVMIVVLGAVGALIGRRFGGRSCRVAVGSGLLAAGSVGAWVGWQNALRESVGAAPVTVSAAVSVLVVATLLPVVVVAVPRRLALAILGVGVLVSSSVFAGGTAAAGVPDSPARTFEAIDSAERGVRIYEPLDDSSIEERADRAVRRLVTSEAMRMRAIVVTFPTGSGWVDARFVRGAEQALDGQIAILAVQYTAMRSWQAYLFHRAAVEEAAVAVVDALDRLVPAGSPPLYFYGQSLGALGVEAAVERARHVGLSVTESLVAGPPAGFGRRAGVLLVNSSDPVVTWSLDLALRPAAMPSGCVIGGTATPIPPWMPVASFIQASVDLVLANDNPPGVGHRYSEAQGTALFDVPRGCAA